MKKKINLDVYAELKLDLKEKNLEYLFEFFNSDKGNKFINQYEQPYKKNDKVKIDGHDYAKIYEEYFKKIKDKHLKILEIGAFYGNAAAALFFYFRNSKIFSADIFPDLFSYKSKRIFNFYVNSSSEQSIKDSILSLDNKFDIIIEDALHSYKDQIISLFMLFPKLNPGGIFITEELDFPDTRDDMNEKKQKPTLRDILIKIKSGYDFENSLISQEQKKYFLSNFHEINIYKGRTNEIAIITKKNE